MHQADKIAKYILKVMILTSQQEIFVNQNPFIKCHTTTCCQSKVNSFCYKCQSNKSAQCLFSDLWKQIKEEI